MENHDDMATSLASEPRATDKNPRQLRQAGLIPATLYGAGQPPVSIQVPEKAFYMAYRDGEDFYTLESHGVVAKAHQVQVHSVSHAVLNIEFLRQA
jgi:ribosomal protein L25 (general stress protein Ctc)